MGSKGIKLLFALLVIPMIALSQGVAFRKADTALVTSDNGQFRIFKSQPYYSSLLALKEPKFTTLSVSKGGTGRTTIPVGVLLKGNATGAMIDAVAGTDYVIPSALTPLALNSAVVHNTGNETIGGIKTFTSVIKGITPVATVDLTTKAYVDAADDLKLNLSNILTVTPTLDFPNTLSNSNSSLNVTVTGAVVGNVVVIGLPVSLMSTMSSYNCNFYAWVSVSDSVSIRFNNNDPSAAHDLASAVFTIKVFK